MTHTAVVLWIVEIPRVTTWPPVQQFVGGSTVRVACSAVAFPPPTFAWRYGDSGQMVETAPEDEGRGDTPVEDHRRISTDHEGLLTIRNASREDAGRWECIATNDQGVGSDVARLQYIGTIHARRGQAAQLKQGLADRTAKTAISAGI